MSASRGLLRSVMRKKSLSQVARRHRLKAIILFGSRATARAGLRSDWDICVSAPDFRTDELRLLEDLSSAVQADVDLCIFERVGPSLRATVAMEGKLLHGSRDHFDRLRLRGIREWQDSRKYRQAIDAFLDRSLP